MKKLTKEEFINRSKEVHGNKYDYSDVEYVNATTLVKIICNVHGSFYQRPCSHLNSKQGCPKCSHQSYPKTLDVFIEQAKKKYGDKYSYENVDYINNKTHVIVNCKEHGEFKVRPDNFLHGHGCPKCAIKMKKQCNPWTTEFFIKKSKEIYGDLFSYEKTEYKNYETSVIITCKKHGDFLVTPDNFLHLHSCPNCSTSLMEIKLKLILDENNIKYEQQKTFEWLKYIGNLKLDFYLPEYNVAIECQGMQHFKPIELFGGKKTFEITQKRDNIKKELCEKNGVKILYFSTAKDKLPNYVIKNKNRLINEICGK